jgi:predicted TIM-barrel fold metal-dependent hydrolase
MSLPVYVDGFTRIGPRPKKHPEHAWKLSHLLAEMDHCSISGAMVSYTMAVSYDPMRGNRELSAMLAPYPYLRPIWNVIPAATDEFPPPGELDKLLRDHDVRAVSINPKTNAWDWLASSSGDLFAYLQDRRLLTMLDKPEMASWRELEVFLQQYPDLPLLLTGAWWSEQRYLLPLLARYPNLHLSFDSFQIHYGIEYLEGKGLGRQMCFASNAPLMSMGAHRTFVDYADISAEAKSRVASGNLLRLLGDLPTPAERLNANEDAYMAAARRGEPLPVPVIDLHMHILHPGLNCAGGGYRMDRGGPDGVFPLLERLGVKGGGFMSWNGTVSGDSVPGNQAVVTALDLAPPGYFGLPTFDTLHYTQDELARLIPEAYSDPRMVGMKPYQVYGVEYTHPAYDIWWRYGNEHSLYALIHRTRNDCQELDVLAPKYPRVRWVIAHCGSDYHTADKVIECCKRNPNVFAEITLTPVTQGIIDYLVAGCGADRVIYGSDLPMRDPRQQLGWVVYSKLPLDIKRKVLCENALAVVRPGAGKLPAYNRPPGL